MSFERRIEEQRRALIQQQRSQLENQVRIEKEQEERLTKEAEIEKRRLDAIGATKAYALINEITIIAELKQALEAVVRALAPTKSKGLLRKVGLWIDH